MKITEAINTADTEHVVYFLLSAYVETLEYCDAPQYLLSDEVRRLPIAGMPDIAQRACVLAGVIDRCAQGQSKSFIEEGLEVFEMAMQRLQYLQGTRQFVHCCQSLFPSGPHSYQCLGRTDLQRLARCPNLLL